MNAEALRLTLETGDVHYYSRSRKKLWKKGESSGEVQKLIEMRTDCDQDVVLMLVEQTGRGAACHTGRKSCFYRIVEGTDTLRQSGEPRLFDPKDVYQHSVVRRWRLAPGSERRMRFDVAQLRAQMLELAAQRLDLPVLLGERLAQLLDRLLLEGQRRLQRLDAAVECPRLIAPSPWL